jgi:hypothetical protein
MEPLGPKIYSPVLSISSTLPLTTSPTNCNMILYPVPSNLHWSTFNDVDNLKLNGKNGLRRLLREFVPVTATLVVAVEKGAEDRIVRKVRAIAEEEARGVRRRNEGEASVGESNEDKEKDAKVADADAEQAQEEEDEEDEEAVEDELFSMKGFNEVQDFNRQQRWGGSCTYHDLGEESGGERAISWIKDKRVPDEDGRPASATFPHLTHPLPSLPQTSPPLLSPPHPPPLPSSLYSVLDSPVTFPVSLLCSHPSSFSATTSPHPPSPLPSSEPTLRR